MGTDTEASLVFLKRRELHFEANHAPGSMLLGDLVGRGEQALVLGGLDGSLAVFKSLDSTEPCALASNLGGIRVLVIGTLGQGRHQRRLLVAITADSTVHGFDFSTFRPTPRKGPDRIHPSITSWVECPVSSAVIADLDGDGVGELVVGGTDGSVDFLTWDLAGDVGAAAMAPLAAKGSWKAPAAVTSLAAVGRGFLVVGLETGTIEVLSCSSGYRSLVRVDLEMGGGLPLPTCGWGGPVICCSLDHEDDGVFAVAALDGRIARARICSTDGGGGEATVVWRTEWASETPYPIFALSPFRLRQAGGGGGFAACGWSGATVLVEEGSQKVFDPAKMLVPPLRGFRAGSFTDEPVLVYTTADGRVVIFHDLEQQLAEDPSINPGLQLLKAEDTSSAVKAWLDTYTGELEKPALRMTRGSSDASKS